MRAQEEHVESGGHAGFLVVSRGEKIGKVAAQLWPAAAAGLGQKAQQAAHRRDTHRMKNLTALAAGLGEPGFFKRSKVKGGRGPGKAEPTDQFAGGKTVWPFGDEQPQQIKAGALG